MMTNVFLALFALALFGYIVGLINPKWVIRWGSKRTRGRVILYLGPLMGIFALGFLLSGPLAPEHGAEGPTISTYVDEELLARADSAIKAVDALLTQRGYGPMRLLQVEEGYPIYEREELGLYISDDPAEVKIEWFNWWLEPVESEEIEGLINDVFKVFAQEIISDKEVEALMRSLHEGCLKAEEQMRQISPELSVGQVELDIEFGDVLATIFCRKMIHSGGETVEKSLAFARLRRHR
jgi:hypothetical protein